MSLENFVYDGILKPEEVEEMSHVHFTPFAYMFSAKMCNLHELEVGWNLMTRVDNGKMVLSLPYYPENDRVTGGTCYTSEKGETAMTIFMVRKGLRKLGFPYKCWAHSHVSMGVFASSKDNQTIAELTQKNDWYYRLIENNKKDISLMLFYKTPDGNSISSVKCTYEISPWSWGKEQECYPDINSVSGIESHINNLKKDYNYSQFINRQKPAEYKPHKSSFFPPTSSERHKSSFFPPVKIKPLLTNPYKRSYFDEHDPDEVSDVDYEMLHNNYTLDDPLHRFGQEDYPTDEDEEIEDINYTTEELDDIIEEHESNPNIVKFKR